MIRCASREDAAQQLSSDSHVTRVPTYSHAHTQVGIVGVNLIGEPLSGGPELPPGGYLQLHPPVTRGVPYYNAAAAEVADLNLDIHVDTVTAGKIRELARAKVRERPGAR